MGRNISVMKIDIVFFDMLFSIGWFDIMSDSEVVVMKIVSMVVLMLSDVSCLVVFFMWVFMSVWVGVVVISYLCCVLWNLVILRNSVVIVLIVMLVYSVLVIM